MSEVTIRDVEVVGAMIFFTYDHGHTRVRATQDLTAPLETIPENVRAAAEAAGYEFPPAAPETEPDEDEVPDQTAWGVDPAYTDGDKTVMFHLAAPAAEDETAVVEDEGEDAEESEWESKGVQSPLSRQKAKAAKAAAARKRKQGGKG